MSFALLAWIATGFDVLVLGALLLRPWSIGSARRKGQPLSVSIPAALVAVLVFCPVAAIKLYVLRVLGTNLFGFMRLAYMDGVVALPVLGLVVLLLRSRLWRVSRPMRLLAGIAIVAGGIGAYASLIEPFRLKLEDANVSLRSERAGREPVTVGVLADIQTDDIGEHELAAVELLMQHKPDLILIPGDLWQGPLANGLPSEAGELRAMLSRLSAPGGVYFVRGNLEAGWDPRPLFVGTPVQMLSDQVIRVQIRDRKVTLAGLDFSDSPQRRRVLDRLEADTQESDIRLVVGHVPDSVLELRPDSRVDLFIAGHTHGGQIVLPLLGPPVTFSRLPGEIASGGLHELAGRHIYVSRGVGWERGQAPRVRLLCPPEVSLLTLVNR